MEILIPSRNSKVYSHRDGIFIFVKMFRFLTFLINVIVGSFSPLSGLIELFGDALRPENENVGVGSENCMQLD